jgi:hypothetical protein
MRGACHGADVGSHGMKTDVLGSHWVAEVLAETTCTRSLNRRLWLWTCGAVALPSILNGMVPLRLPSPLVEIRDGRVESRDVRLYLKRDDLIHPELPGNKWRKLKYNLVAARGQDKSTLLTFGGAYSNHIRATAAAGHYFDFNTIGVIRGEEHLPLNSSLQRVMQNPETSSAITSLTCENTDS